MFFKFIWRLHSQKLEKPVRVKKYDAAIFSSLVFDSDRLQGEGGEGGGRERTLAFLTSCQQTSLRCLTFLMHSIYDVPWCFSKELKWNTHSTKCWKSMPGCLLKSRCTRQNSAAKKRGAIISK